MKRKMKKVVWSIVALVLVTFAVPWFMWESDTIIVGLPTWIWWHIGWMFLTSIIFWLFTSRDWGLGVEKVNVDD